MYNSRESIVDCINSVLNQTRFDLIDRIIVVDDGSTDNSEELVKKEFKKEEKIKIIIKENGGVSSARNVGIREADSEWIALLDSDDVWLPEKIEKQWDQILKNDQILFIGCNRNNENIHWGRKVSNDLYMLDLKHILLKNWPHTSTAIINKKVFLKVGFFNEEMRYAEDIDLWNRIAYYYPLYYIPISYEIAGGNKCQFGERGLSANLKDMHVGNIRNIRYLRKEEKISFFFYAFLLIYNNAKYVRRILITKKNKKQRL